jgi:hypothetical protein
VAAPAFSLGWVTASLFDERRLDIARVDTTKQVKAPYNPGTQLPLVADLDPERKRALALADLLDLLLAGTPGVSADDVMAAALPDPVDPVAYKGALLELHVAILSKLVADDQQIAAYQLGLALSDTCWLPSVAGGPQSLMTMFQRGQVAALKTWLASAGTAIPDPAAATVLGQSLENWQDWIEVNAKTITEGWRHGQADAILKALRIQAMAWYSVLVDDPQTSGAPSMNAWVQAGKAVVRAARVVTVSVLRRFWWLVTIIAALIGGVLYLVLANLHGSVQVVTSVLWIAGAVGLTGAGLQSAVGKAVSGVGAEVWVAARADAKAWSVTWLPTPPAPRGSGMRAALRGGQQRRGLDRAGVAMPRYRKNLETVADVGIASRACRSTSTLTITAARTPAPARTPMTPSGRARSALRSGSRPPPTGSGGAARTGS